jgi:hypothetical protein
VLSTRSQAPKTASPARFLPCLPATILVNPRHQSSYVSRFGVGGCVPWLLPDPWFPLLWYMYVHLHNPLGGVYINMRGNCHPIVCNEPNIGFDQPLHPTAQASFPQPGFPNLAVASRHAALPNTIVFAMALWVLDTTRYTGLSRCTSTRRSRLG